MLYSALNASEDSHFVFHSTESGATAAGPGIITVPDAHLLFHAEFNRSGDDLKLIGEDGKSFSVADYFKTEKHATLYAPDGAKLTGDIVAALAGPLNPGQYAQATAPQGTAPAIGHVATVSGSASVVRNGVTMQLNTGDPILKGDVVQTGSGSALGITFADGSTFSLNAGARMVINEFVFDPNGSGNAQLVSLVQGTMSFLAGQVAKTGDMKIGTPVATMGIRGTAGTVVSSDNGQVTISIHDEGDGINHVAEIFDSSGHLIGRASSNGGQWTLQATGQLTVLATETGKTDFQIQQELSIVQQLLNTKSFGDQFINNPTPDRTDNNNTKTADGHGTQIQLSDKSDFNHLKDVSTGGDPIVVTVTKVDPDHPNDTKVVVDLPPLPPAPPQVPTNLAPIFIADRAVQQATHEQQYSFAPRMSDDGQRIVFAVSDTLPGNHDGDGANDMIFYDRANNHSASMTNSVTGIALHPGETFEGLAALSKDGHFVVFQGHYQITEIDSNNQPFTHSQSEIFLYDSQTNTTKLLHSGGGAPAINADGSLIAIEDFVGDENNSGGHSMIALLDRDGNLIDTITAPNGMNAWNPALSADGNLVTFFSADSNDPDAHAQVYLYNRTNDHLELVSHNAAGNAGNGDSGTVTYIPDGFNHQEEAWASSFSSDGRYVVFQSNASDLVAHDANGHADIFVFDTITKEIERVSLDMTDDASKAGDSIRPEISSDGRYILFVSSASDLVAGDDNQVPDVFLYDRATRATTLVSSDVAGFLGNNDSQWGATLNVNGILIAFGSQATNLTGGTDPNGTKSDIFVVDLSNATKVSILDDASVAQLTASGKVAFADTNDTHTIDHTNINPLGTGSQNNWGMLTAALSDHTSSGGEVAWNYSVDENLTHNLKPGDTHIDKFNVIVTDSAGNQAAQEIDVTTVGIDHTPVFAQDKTTVELTEGTQPLESSGRIYFADNDKSETGASYRIAATDVAIAGAADGLPDPNTLLSYLKPFSIEKAAGSTVGYVASEFSAPDGAFSYLKAGETVTLDYTVQLSDADGRTTHHISVTITGSNDDPVATDDVFLGVPNGWTLGANGHQYKYVSDGLIGWQSAAALAAAAGGYLATIADSNENNLIFALVGNHVAWLGGSDAGHEGQWQWVTQPGGASDFSYTQWANGQPDNFFNEDYLVTWGNHSWNDLADNFLARLIAGVDGYVIERDGQPGANYLQITEDAPVSIDTALLLANDSDPDQHDTLNVTGVSQASALGAIVTLNNNGTITYDPTHAASLQALAAGATTTDTFTYTVDDGHGGVSTATVTLTVNGVNDAPAKAIFTPDSHIAAADDSGTRLSSHSAIGHFTATDPDTGDTLTYSLDDDSSNGFKLTSSGALSVGNSNLQGGNYALTIVATDQAGAHSNTAVNVWVGSSGNNTVSFENSSNPVIAFGLNGNDRITSSGKDDVLTGGGGNDTFIFKTGNGQDIVTDFHHGENDRIDLQAYTSAANFNDLQITVAGHDSIIDLGGGNTVTLQNTVDDHHTTLVANDFILHPGAA